MKPSRCALVAALAASLVPAAHAGPLAIAQYPLFLNTAVRPNVLVVYDNSESMDGTMAGKLIAGDDPTTRGNIARSVIRNTVASFGGQFNWGLESFNVSGTGYYDTYPYYLGDATTMVFTDDCVGGISASNAGLRCIANPQWNGVSIGDRFVTYDRASDDPDINDVLYIGGFGWGAWATSTGGPNYQFWFAHNPGTAFEANMAAPWYNLSFTPTDAGYIPFNPPISRQLYIYRAWGFLGYPNGWGVINEPVLPSAASGHIANINSLLASETKWGGEIKNGSIFTPLAGSLYTARDYFAGTYGGYPSPISLTCQRNFVLLATDGNPTSRTDGSMYSLAEQANTFNPFPAPGSWTFSVAANDVFNAVTPLRSVNVSGKTYDVQTYVVGMGDTVANPSSIATLNEIANRGGTTVAYLASDTASLAAAFAAISTDIAAKTSAAAAVSLNSGSWGTGTNLYQARFNSGGWTGQLIAYAVNSDGSLGAVQWDAGLVINLQDWNTGRSILTYKPSASLGSRGIPFRWPAAPASPTATEMDVAQSSALSKDGLGVADAYGPDRLAYLRGNAANEALTCPTCTPKFRSRPVSRLGDIIHSGPVYVAAPQFGYPDGFESASYASFASAKASRKPTIYVGANDGMLHAFDAANGRETMAYVPAKLYGSLSSLTGQSLANSAPAPHRYYVDGTPNVGDVFYGGSWHSLLVGAYGAGGQGVYALDVTNPDGFSESTASSIVRWEFTDANDADLGSVFGQPLIVKTRNGRWSVIVGNGYNNTDADGSASTTGRAVLFVLDAQDGSVIAKLTTSSGSVSNPNGLSGPIAVDSDSDGVADIVYAGDLRGNLWKFDLSSSSPGSWTVAFGGSPLFSTPSDQPITVRPDVARFTSGGFIVTFGTGRYVDVSDPTMTDDQAFYGIRDDGTGPVGGTSELVRQRVVGTGTGADGNTYRITTHAVDPPKDTAIAPYDNTISMASYKSGKRGWYLKLPTDGERAVSDPAIRAGRVIFNTLIPDSDPCSYGGTGWVMEVDVMTGNRFDGPSFDTNSDGTVSDADRIAYNAGMDVSSGRAIASIPAAAGFLSMPVPKGKAAFENKYVNTSAGGVAVIGETGGAGSAGRGSWRQVR
jgi:type IV pilus assembly protein PilY1